MANRAVPLLLAGALLVVVAQRSKRKRRRRALQSAGGPRSSRATAPSNIGIVLEGSQLQITDWNHLMREGSRQVKRAVAEGANTPDEIVARMFYRAMPQHDWPPKPGTQLAEQYGAIVNLVAATVDEKLRPGRDEQTIRRGFRVVR